MKITIENQGAQVSVEVEKDHDDINSVLSGLIIPALRALTFSDEVISKVINIDACNEVYVSGKKAELSDSVLSYEEEHKAATKKEVKSAECTKEVDKFGIVTWFDKDGFLHNPHGPAVTRPDGYGGWRLYRDGRCVADGYEAHYKHGKPHNPHGSAVKFTDGAKEYWLDGVRMTEKEHKAATNTDKYNAWISVKD